MANSLIDAYRQKMAALGTPDDRDDTTIMYEDLIPAADRNKDLLTQFPDFAQEYGQFRDANAPSIAGEFGRAFKAGAEETGSTYAGLGAIADIPGAAEQSQKLQGEAAENAPTVGSLEDIAPGESGMSKLFSKDTARYLAAKAGGAIPSLAEMAGIALGGAAVGSAIEPGAGTVAGGAEGVVEEVLGRGIIKTAIRNVVKRKLLEDASEAAVADAIRAGDKTAIETVTQEAKRLAAGRTEAATNLANVYAMSAGGIYNETGDRPTALGLGAVAAATAAPPFLSLPARVVRGLFPKMTAEAAQAAAGDLVKSNADRLIAKLGRAGGAAATGTAGVLGMEAASIVAKNITDGKDPLDLDDADWKRLREAAIGGALASAPFAALAARSPVETTAAKTLGGDEMQAGDDPNRPQTAAPEAPAEGAATPSPVDVARQVRAYSPDEARARLRQLSADTSRDENDEKEYQLLRALAPSADLPAPTPPPEAPPESPAPAEAVPPVVEASAPAEAVASDTPTFKDAGFESQEAFDSHYAANHERDVYETPDEYARRLYCQAAA